MIGEICREMGVACLMNGDVTGRDQALELAQEYSVDGAMIATAAEKNPSCFRTTEQGGLLHWKEVAREYIKTAMEVENKWGNTKFLLSQIIPGKDPCYTKATQTKSYQQCINAMGFEELNEMAREVDEALGMRTDKIAERTLWENNSARATGSDLESIALAA